MIGVPVIMAASAAFLLIGAVLLVTGTGSSQRLLRERIAATGEIKSQASAGAESLIFTPTKQTRLLQLASFLGYESDLPAAYAASPKIVGPLSTLIGVVIFNLSGRVVPKSAALVIGVVVGVIVARTLFKRKSKKYRTLLFKQIPDTMSLLLRAVRAGLPITEAIRSVGRESMSPTKDEFARVAGEAALGSPIEVAMQRLAQRTTLQEYAFFSVIIGLHSQTGGNLSETLENMADMVRRRVAMAAKSRALSAEGRLSAAVVAALPFVVGLLTFLMNPGYINEFFTNPRGPMLIFIFVALLTTGLFVTHLLIQKSSEET